MRTKSKPNKYKSVSKQHSSYDLVAIFKDESEADVGEVDLRKAGFGDDEILRLITFHLTTGRLVEKHPSIALRFLDPANLERKWKAWTILSDAGGRLAEALERKIGHYPYPNHVFMVIKEHSL